MKILFGHYECKNCEIVKLLQHQIEYLQKLIDSLLAKQGMKTIQEMPREEGKDEESEMEKLTKAGVEVYGE